MKHPTDAKIQDLVAAFAAEYIACRPDLQTGREFPIDIWQKMGEAGLFKIGIAKTYGGQGGGYLSLLKAGEAFVKSGYNLGLAISWLYQQVIARLIISGLGTPKQRRQYLPDAADEKIIFSFAVSEPGHGAHPKMLTTSAKKQTTGYMLNGEKTYLTNGPIADIYIVVAVTDDTKPQKRFTAFIVPRIANGITVTQPLALNFLKPSPHGGIKLENCLIGRVSVLGNEGDAWRDIVVPFGEIEDVVMSGPVLGGMDAQLILLLELIRKQAVPVDRALQEKLGALSSLLETMRIVAYEASERLDQGKNSPIPLVITFAHLAAEFHAGIAQLTDQWKIKPSAEYTCLQNDMQALTMLKKGLLRVRQEKIGVALLKV